MSLFDEVNLAEISHPGYPGERLVACRNPALAKERARRREELLAATEALLAEVKAAVEREKRPYRGKDKIALRVGKLTNRYKVGKHFELQIGEDSFSFSRKADQVAARTDRPSHHGVRARGAAAPRQPVEQADRQRAPEVASGDLGRATGGGDP